MSKVNEPSSKLYNSSIPAIISLITAVIPSIILILALLPIRGL